MKKYVYDILEVKNNKKLMSTISDNERDALTAAVFEIKEDLFKHEYNIADVGIARGADIRMPDHEYVFVAIVSKGKQRKQVVYVAVAIGELSELTIDDDESVKLSPIKYY